MSLSAARAGREVHTSTPPFIERINSYYAIITKERHRHY
jgi:hypothetical protein